MKSRLVTILVESTLALGTAAGSSVLTRSHSAFAQIGASKSPINARSVPETLAGQVVNAKSGAPVARALVQIGGRAMLTNQEGRFRFEQSNQPASSITVSKPGFTNTPERNEGGGTLASVDGDATSLTVTLWPESLILGSVLTSDGEPLAQIPVIAHRSVFDDQGHRLQPAGMSKTDSHGHFRLPVPAGDYVVETQFTPRSFERGDAILPATYPARSSNASGTFHVGSGEEVSVQLHTATGRTHAVTLALDSDEESSPPRITAYGTDGTYFAVDSSRSRGPGTVQVDLPRGTYSLHATRFSREGMQFGVASVTVAENDVLGPALHLSALPSIPVEVVVDSSSSQAAASSNTARPGNSLPNAMQFNLVLEPLEFDPASPFQFGIHPTQSRDGSVSFAAPPGIYRLAAGASSGWYIRGATSRGTDLTQESLIISPGSTPSPITVVVSNQMGSLQGVTHLSGAAAGCWIYLVSSNHALPAVITRRSDSTGAFQLSDLPPGTYQAVAFPYRHSADLQSPAVLGEFATHVASVSITPGATTSLDLEAVPARELKP